MPRSRTGLWLLPLIGLVIGCGDGDQDLPQTLVAMTFNTGSGASVSGDPADNAGFGPQQSQWADDHYGNGLAWEDAIARTAAFIARVDPDLIGFQEIFYPPECQEVPVEAHVGFVCQRWQAGDPLVIEEVLGEAYQIACHVGTPDECVAVHERLGRFRGCDARFCLEGVFGRPIADCGDKSRVGRVVVELAAGGELTMTHVHAKSGLTERDDNCRAQEVDQVFVDVGDGAPAVRAAPNIIVGDFNVDPWRFPDLASGRKWNEQVGTGKRFDYLLTERQDRWATYLGLFQIDQLIADTLVPLRCATASSDSADSPPVLPYAHFDHQPVWCELRIGP